MEFLERELRIAEGRLGTKLSYTMRDDREVFPLVIYSEFVYGDFDKELIRLGVETADKRVLYLSRPTNIQTDLVGLIMGINDFLSSIGYERGVDFDDWLDPIRGGEADVRDLMLLSEWHDLQRLEDGNRELDIYAVEDRESRWVRTI